MKTKYFKNRQEWRTWLADHFDKESEIWFVFPLKNSGKPALSYNDAVEEALCFGWIDSKPNKRDQESYYLYFSPRKPKSKWSRVNKIKVEQLLKAGKIAPAGQAAIDLAKKNGTWYALDKVENLEVPVDLIKKLSANKSASQFWDAFPPSAKKGILQWIESAKRDETRKKRIDETVKLAALNVRANQYTPK